MIVNNSFEKVIASKIPSTLDRKSRLCQSTYLYKSMARNLRVQRWTLLVGLAALVI